MEEWLAVRGLQVIKELDTERGRLFEVAPESGDHLALRVYDAPSSVTAYGLDPQLLRQGQVVSVKSPYLLHIQELSMNYTCSRMEEHHCREAQLFMLMELASGHLGHWMAHLRKEAPPAEVARLLFDMLQGVHALHEHHWVHRRLHPGNVMMVEQNTQFHAKIGDFHDLVVDGARLQHDEVEAYHDETQLFPFLPPEWLVGHLQYETSGDVWSWGVLAYWVLTHTLPFLPVEDRRWWGKDPVSLQHAKGIWAVLGTPQKDWRVLYMGTEEVGDTATEGTGLPPLALKGWPKGVTKQAFDLIRQCLQLDPKKRPTTAHLLKHPFFRAFRFSPTPVKGVAAVPRGHVPSVVEPIRRELVKASRRDVEGGDMLFYPTLMAFSLFDRVVEPFREYWQRHRSTQVHHLYALFCACYMIGIKLMTDVQQTEVFDLVFGSVCARSDNARFLILHFEREITNFLQFQFHADGVAKRRETLEEIH